MRRVLIGALLFSLFSCEADETRMSRMADDLCNCFSNVNDMVSVETLAEYDKLWKEEDMMKVEQAWAELDSIKREKMTAEMTTMGKEMMGESGSMQCITRLHGKYGILYDLNKSGHAAELIELMEPRSECRVAVYYLRSLERLKKMGDKMEVQ